MNIVAPTLSATATTQTAGGFTPPDGAAGGPGAGGGFGQAAQAAATSDVVLNAPVTLSVILIAVGLAVVGGLLAGAIGGWRASRLRPAEALRAVA